MKLPGLVNVQDVRADPEVSDYKPLIGEMSLNFLLCSYGVLLPK